MSAEFILDAETIELIGVITTGVLTATGQAGLAPLVSVAEGLAKKLAAQGIEVLDTDEFRRRLDEFKARGDLETE